MTETKSPIVFPVPLQQDLSARLGSEPLKIVDVGALAVENLDDLYSGLSAHWNCSIVGFEPQFSDTTEIVEGNARKLVLPYALGDGRKTAFHQTSYSAASSTYEPNAELLNQFWSLAEMLEVTERREIPTRRLDDIDEVDDCDLLKLDVQGGELNVLKGARKILKRIPVVITEVEFSPVYSGQPLFTEVHEFMGRNGFLLLNLENLGFGAYRAGLTSDAHSRILWADAVYVKTDALLGEAGPRKILLAAIVAHYALQNYGYAAALFDLHDRLFNTNLLASYQAAVW